MSVGRRGGERRRHARPCACTRRTHDQSSHALRGRVLHSVQRPVHVNPHYAPSAQAAGGEAFDSASRLGKPGQPGTTNTGVETGGRSAARRVPPLLQGRGRGTSRKGRRPRSPSLRGSQEPGFGCPHVVMQLQKSVGDVWPRISSANALQKERSGSSERGPSSEHGSAGETVGRRIERKARRESASPVKTRERTGAKTQGGERSSSSGSRIARKAVRESRDRGRKGHRILRRAPTDGSHPGSSRSVALHGAAWTRVSAVIGIPRPAPNLQKEVVRPGCSARESTRGVGTNRRLRQGCQRLDRVEHRGNNTPALVS
jgi:hypothetical protein